MAAMHTLAASENPVLTVDEQSDLQSFIDLALKPPPTPSPLIQPVPNSIYDTLRRLGIVAYVKGDPYIAVVWFADG
jgi:hypothetical protein